MLQFRDKEEKLHKASGGVSLCSARAGMVYTANAAKGFTTAQRYAVQHLDNPTHFTTRGPREKYRGGTKRNAKIQHDLSEQWAVTHLSTPFLKPSTVKIRLESRGGYHAQATEQKNMAPRTIHVSARPHAINRTATCFPNRRNQMLKARVRIMQQNSKAWNV